MEPEQPEQGTAGVSGAGELRTTDEPRSSFISGTVFFKGERKIENKPVQYSEIEGEAIFEGDIVLGSADELEIARRRHEQGFEGLGVAVTGEQFRWPGGVIAYRIDPALPDPQRVTQAIAHWEEKTDIRFKEQTDETNFVTFRPGNGCSSQIGMRGREQFVTLASGCLLGNVIHEIGHTVGLWHEQSREDRDSFVTVDFTNIQASKRHNFNQHIADGDDIGLYDYGSIMHYPPNAFAIDASKPTIIAPQPIGQRDGLSPNDIATVREIYTAQLSSE